MGSFGENLRREREMRGVTLEEIAESTKISTRLLRALEQEHFSDLPGGVFTRSFIRHYADYLGLDSEHVLAEYRQVAPQNSEYDLNRLPAGTSFSTRPSRGTAIPWVVAAILLGGGYATYRYAHRPLEASLPSLVAPPTSSSTQASTPSGPGVPTSGGATQPAASENTAPPVSESATRSPEAASPTGGDNPSSSAQPPGDAASGAQSAAGQEAASSSKTASLAPAGANATATAPVLGEGELVLKVTTTEDAWLAIAADGKMLMQRILPVNSVRIFRANDAFDVTTGNAEGTSLTLDGQPLKPLGRHGEFRKVHLTRDGVQSPAKPPVNPSN
ncbi:MAG TPA: RodZ domain-containing protein [Terriglobia bacterium]|nr:RodZ domain-containing protein [Terriglobia bacterium]